MYLDIIADRIRSHVPEDRLSKDDVEALFHLYAVLLRVKGPDVTQSDVHDVWSAWTARRVPDHESLVPYAELPDNVQEEDQIFVEAIRRTCAELGLMGASRPQFREILFPSGPPKDDTSNVQTLELYKMMVQSSESLVNRRQVVNTFFLTMNGVILTALGLIVQNSGGERVLGSLGVLMLSSAGALLCGAWRSLIISFGQLNRGKFQVINTIERYLTVSVYTAEWEALGRGENPRIYRSFTSREIWVPTALLALHIIVAVSAIWITATRLI